MGPLILFLLIGLCAGWLAGQVMKGGSYGMPTDLIIGAVGSMIGGHLLSLVGLHASGIVGSLISATVGAIALIVALRYLKRV